MSIFDRSSRITAVALFTIAGVVPIGIWVVYLFGVNPEGWRGSLEFALFAESEARPFFVLITTASIFSLLAALVMAIQRRRVVLKVVLVGGVIQTIAYAIAGGWFLAFLAASPLWWAYKVQHEA